MLCSCKAPGELWRSPAPRRCHLSPLPRLHRSGMAKAIGVSNYAVEHLEAQHKECPPGRLSSFINYRLYHPCCHA